MRKSAAFALALALAPAAAPAEDRLAVGSKNFTESFVLAEMMAQVIEAKAGLRVERRHALGGTQICFESLNKGAIDLYPEYSGTGTLVILKDPSVPSGDLARLSAIFSERFGLTWLAAFGFENSFALAVRSEDAEKWRVETYSDLARREGLAAAFSYEFLERPDGYPALARTYGFRFARVDGIQHDLAYRAIRSGKIDVTDAYSTDGELLEFRLTVLRDDKHFFPSYLAAPLVRSETLERFPAVREALDLLAGKIDQAAMARLNLEAAAAAKEYPRVVSRFLEGLGVAAEKRPRTSKLGEQTVRHLALTATAVLLASLAAIPAGILIRNRKRAAGAVLAFCGILQTVPGIAMLGFMIPLFGIGVLPATVALFLYSLLPIVRNTVVGLQQVPRHMIEVGRGQGLSYRQILRYVEMPLAARTIFAGVRTAAVISVGTATLAAFIGAGGLGEPIVTGIALNDTGLILSGAIPAAILALLVDGALLTAERLLLPRGIRMTYGPSAIET